MKERVDREVQDITCKWWWYIAEEMFVDDQGHLRSYQLSGAELDWLQDVEVVPWWHDTAEQPMHVPLAVSSVSWPGERCCLLHSRQVCRHHKEDAGTCFA